MYDYLQFDDVLTIVIVSLYICLHFICYVSWYHLIKWLKMDKVLGILIVKDDGKREFDRSGNKMLG